jgi:hypothetical protein
MRGCRVGGMESEGTWSRREGGRGHFESEGGKRRGFGVGGMGNEGISNRPDWDRGIGGGWEGGKVGRRDGE